ncbi:hypothetical protein J4Q44_G00290600 [Coregonus suidteri]|uniref:Uncharacterized protein n=1 Tax=Coregonus suidteri TaxID=861788 RepID=A0AAN8KY06_9TELE
MAKSEQIHCWQKTPKKEARPRTPPEKKRLKVSEDFSSCLSEEQPQSPTLKGEDIQALAIRPEDLEKEGGEGSGGPPPPPRTPPHSHWTTQDRGDLASTPRGWVLPHSILGSLEDFRTEMQARGETELVRRVPAPQRAVPQVCWGVRGVQRDPLQSPGGQRDVQSHALQHWHTHMTPRDDTSRTSSPTCSRSQ